MLSLDGRRGEARPWVGRIEAKSDYSVRVKPRKMSKKEEEGIIYMECSWIKLERVKKGVIARTGDTIRIVVKE